MSVEHAVELVLDEPAAGVITGLMDRLEAAGIPSLRQLAPHVHPHVSLAVSSGSASALAEALGGVGRVALPTSLRLSSLGAFVAPARVVYVGVTPTRALLDLVAAVHERLDAHGLASRDLYRPGSYVPHVTVAMHVASIGGALAVLEDAPLPVEAVSARMAVVEVPTGRLVADVAS